METINKSTNDSCFPSSMSYGHWAVYLSYVSVTMIVY